MIRLIGRCLGQRYPLWVVLAERATTNGAFSLTWPLCPKDSGPGPHHHDQDEGFFVTEGQITYVAGARRW